MDALVALHTRTAAPRLVDPAPGDAALEQILRAGLRAPDHGMLRPWRFLVVEGDARLKLGQLFVDALQPPTAEEADKLRASPLRAPLVIVAIAAVKDHAKVPAIEQIESCAAAVQNMSVAIHALGFASIWRTGAPAYDPRVKQSLGMKDSDAIVGFLYVGTPTTRERPAPVLNTADFVEHWR